jgi:hypothetical protein
MTNDAHRQGARGGTGPEGKLVKEDGITGIKGCQDDVAAIEGIGANRGMRQGWRERENGADFPSGRPDEDEVLDVRPGVSSLAGRRWCRCSCRCHV